MHVRVKSLIDYTVIVWGEHQSLPSFQAPRPCSVLKLLYTQTEVSSFADCFEN